MESWRDAALESYLCFMHSFEGTQRDNDLLQNLLLVIEFLTKNLQ